MKKFLKFEPVASLAGLLALGSAVIAGIAMNQNWSGDAVTQVGLIWDALIAFVGTFFVRASVTPNDKVDDVANDQAHDILVKLSHSPVVGGDSV